MSTDRVLSAQEEEILVSDRRSAPKVVGLLLRTDGRLDAPHLGDALESALERHPMARARLVLTGREAPHWHFPEGPERPIVETTCADESELRTAFARLCATPMDLTATPPVRVLLARLPEADALAVIAHHIVMDGIGAVRLTRSIIEAYGGAATDGPPLPDEPPGRRQEAETVAETVAAARHLPPARIASTARSVDRAGYHVAQLDLPARELLPARDGAGATAGMVGVAAGATVNDLLLTALHAAVGRWNRERGRVGGEIRVRIPVTQRTSATRWDSVGNHTSQAVVRSTAGDRASPRDLLSSIVRQTGRIKRDGPAGGPAAVVGQRGPLAALIPPAPRLRLTGLAVGLVRRWLMPTAALSNLGRISQEWTFGASGPDVTSVFFAVFAGSPQGLAVGVTGYRDRTTLTFGCARALFTRDESERFASMFLDELRRVQAVVGIPVRSASASAPTGSAAPASVTR